MMTISEYYGLHKYLVCSEKDLEGQDLQYFNQPLKIQVCNADRVTPVSQLVYSLVCCSLIKASWDDQCMKPIATNNLNVQF